MLPFRLFTISLLFRMRNKISEACTKAAEEVYCQASLQGAFGAMAVPGSLVGRHWGVGGVAVAVSIGMDIQLVEHGRVEPVGDGAFLVAVRARSCPRHSVGRAAESRPSSRRKRPAPLISATSRCWSRQVLRRPRSPLLW